MKRIKAAILAFAFLLSLCLIITKVSEKNKIENSVETTVHEHEVVIPSTVVPETTEDVEIPVDTECNEVECIDSWQLEMLAVVIYQEAGGDGSCDNCRKYVADIVLNRVNHPDFPDTIEGVLTQKRQYGTLYLTGIKWPERAQYESEERAVQRAYDVAGEILSGHHSKLYGDGYIWQAGFKQGKEGFWCCGHYYGKN